MIGIAVKEVVGCVKEKGSHELCESVGGASVLGEVRVIFVLIRVLLAAHEQHVLQVVTQTLHVQMPGR